MAKKAARTAKKGATPAKKAACMALKVATMAKKAASLAKKAACMKVQSIIDGEKSAMHAAQSVIAGEKSGTRGEKSVIAAEKSATHDAGSGNDDGKTWQRCQSKYRARASEATPLTEPAACMQGAGRALRRATRGQAGSVAAAASPATNG